jgi:antitoxin component of RelBE/YafQ-DinJ toxin-antitoxin module
MKEERLQLRIAPKLKEQAQRLAKRRHTTLSALMTLLLQRAVEADEAARRVGPGQEVEQV